MTPTGKTNVVANSKVEKLYDGCAIRENWMPLQGSGGGSLNNYVTADYRWHQTWVDSDGGYLDFQGGLVEGRMILQRTARIDGRAVEQRMVFDQIARDSLEWRWERSTDGGVTWELVWPISYRRVDPR